MANISRRNFLGVLGGLSILTASGIVSACSTTSQSDQEAVEEKLRSLRAENKYKETRIEIGDNFFSPQVAEIEPGTIVIWEHVGRSIHDVVYDDRGKAGEAKNDFTSDVLRGGDKHVWLFEEEGTFNYHCKYHGGPQRGHWGAIKVGSTGRSPSEQDDQAVSTQGN